MSINLSGASIFLVLGVVTLSPIHAVVVHNGTPANLLAPVDDPGWNAIGTISAPAGPASAIFLGNNDGFGWFLTANHVSLSSATLNIGVNNYTVFSGIDQIGTTDIKVFRVNAPVLGITPVTLASSTPAAGADVVMVGFGATGTFATWNAGTDPWTSPGSDASGYEWTGPNVKQWGTNVLHQSGVTDYPPNLSIVTDFDNVAGEGQGSRGDSGGAVFYKNGMNWELIGMMVTVGVTPNGTDYFSSFTGQPSETSVSFINGVPAAKSVTFSAQISDYRSDILNAIPEITTLGFLVFGSLLLARRTSVQR